MSITLSVLLVNFNGLEVLLPCLESIRRYVSVPHEVLLIDNGSTDGSVECATAAFPAVRVLRNRDNLGFAVANNRGAQESEGKYLLLLNTDTVLLTDIAIAVAALEAVPEVGIVGAEMFSPSGSLRSSAAYFPSPARLLLLSRMKMNPQSQPFGPAQFGLFRADRVEGSFLLISRSLYQELGGLNEALFMYGEDTALCRAARNIGRLTVQCKQVRYIHAGGWQSSRTPLLYLGYLAYHRNFSTWPVRFAAVGVLLTGLAARLAYYGAGSVLHRPDAGERFTAFRATLIRLSSAFVARPEPPIVATSRAAPQSVSLSGQTAVRKPRVVLFVHHSNDLYGADIGLLQLMRGLDRKDFTPLVVLPQDAAHLGRLTPMLDAEGVEYLFLHLCILRRRYLHPRRLPLFFRDLFCGIYQLRQLIRERDVALVYSNTIAVFLGALVAALTIRPHFWHIREIIQKPTWLRKGMHLLLRIMPGQIICVSREVCENIAADEPRLHPRMTLVYNGVDAASLMARPLRNLRTELGIAHGVPVVGIIGRITQWKGQGIFVEAAAILHAAHPEVQFVIVGDVFDGEIWNEEYLTRKIAQLGLETCVHRLPFMPDVINAYNLLDVVVLASVLPEPFGRVVVEGMLCGKPVIATRAGGPVEIVVDEVTGLLVPPRDAGQLALAMTRLVHDDELRRRFGKAGQLRAEELFSVQHYIDRIHAMLRAA